MPDSDLEAFQTWLLIDEALSQLAEMAEHKFSKTAAMEIKRLRGLLAAEAQTFQNGAYEDMTQSTATNGATRRRIQ